MPANIDRNVLFALKLWLSESLRIPLVFEELNEVILAVANPSTVAGKTLRWLGECLALHSQIAQDAAQAQSLSGRSSVQAECREWRQRMAMRCSGSASRPSRKHGANGPVR